MRKFNILLMAFAAVLMVSCNPQPEIDNATDLDGNQIFDLTLTHPEYYLVSKYLSTPTETQKSEPVIVCAHGYSASTFEWGELRQWADSLGGFHVSQVLLGGHGRTYADFKEASWDEWQSSIREEYAALLELGYKNIWLAGSSTGCPLIIQMVSAGYFDDKLKPKGIFLIDPIVISSNKQLTMVNALGPVLGYTSTGNSPGEVGHWYTYRPQESLKQLMLLIDKTRLDLESGLTLPEGTYLKVFKVTHDSAADPAGAVLIYKGLQNATGGKVEVEMVDSRFHVFTRLAGREEVTLHDRSNQKAAFENMIGKMGGN